MKKIQDIMKFNRRGLCIGLLILIIFLLLTYILDISIIEIAYAQDAESSEIIRKKKNDISFDISKEILSDFYFSNNEDLQKGKRLGLIGLAIYCGVCLVYVVICSQKWNG